MLTRERGSTSIERYRKFKEFQARIMVATNLLGRGIYVKAAVTLGSPRWSLS